MAKFLIRDDSKIKGWREVDGPLPRTRQLSYVPWAVTLQGRVVYAPTGQHRDRARRGGMRKYDTAVSQERRRKTQTELGSIVLRNPALTRSAVTKVSTGVKRFLTRKLFTDPKIKERYAAKVGKYMYGTKYYSFGRFSDTLPTGTTSEVAHKMWIQALDTLDAGTSFASVMSIQDAAGKLLTKADKQWATYDRWMTRLRPAGKGELFNPDMRGRKGIRGVAPSRIVGIVHEDERLPLPDVQLHNRAVDRNVRTMRHFSPSERIPDDMRAEHSGLVYYRDLDTRNELFGAGPSGTTGTLIAAAKAFAGLDGELVLQYLLAIVGYLVGGGMHSLHESLTTMRLMGAEYNSSSLLAYERKSDILKVAKSDVFPLLPRSFLGSQQFARWRDTYYDVVILGGIHWMFNGNNTR